MRMAATHDDATDATLVARLRLDVFDANAERLGAMSDQAKADLIGVDRATMWRYRTGKITPTLDRALAIAEVLGVDLTELIERVAA